MRFVHVRLRAPRNSHADVQDFYAATMGLELADERVRIGETTLQLEPAAGRPFYHFALLVPGDRFDAALAWVNDRAELLPDPETGDVVFESETWRSRACYFHDPAENIVELIAHAGIGAERGAGAFAGTELLGLSELGVVGDRHTAAASLAELGIDVWDGTLDEDNRLAFAGEQGRTLILAQAGRPWVPTGRPAEPHPFEATVTGTRPGVAELHGSGAVVRSRQEAA